MPSENPIDMVFCSIYRTTYRMNESWQFSFTPWSPMRPDLPGRTRFFGLGEVRLAVLSMVEEGPKHGYQIMKELASRLGSLHRVGSGTVYPVLKQLEHDGLVQYRMNEGRKTYSLTKAGRKVLAGEAEAVRGIWERATEVEELGSGLVLIRWPCSALCRSFNWRPCGRRSGPAATRIVRMKCAPF